MRFCARQSSACFTLLHYVFRTAHGVGGIGGDNLPGHQPVEQHAQCRQELLDRRRRKFALQILDEHSDMERFHVDQFADAVRIAPFGGAADGVKVGSPRVIIVDLGEEERDEPFGGR
jgi:hypothetical protein